MCQLNHYLGLLPGEESSDVLMTLGNRRFFTNEGMVKLPQIKKN